MGKDTNKCDGCGRDFAEETQELEAWERHSLDPCGLCEDCCTHNHGPLYIRASRGIVCHDCRCATDAKVAPEREHSFEGPCAGNCGVYHWGTIGWVDVPNDQELHEALLDLQRHLNRTRKLALQPNVTLTRDELLAKIRKPARDRRGL